MRKITIEKTLYTFPELSESAKENAHKNYLNSMDYFCCEDWRNVLDRFCELFGVKMGKWEISTYYGYHYGVCDYGHGAITNVSGYRLSKYLNNNNLYYYRWDKKFIGIEEFCNNCGLTGFCGDYDALIPVLETSQYKRNYDSYEDMIDDCLKSLFRAWLEDMEYEESMEYFEEYCEANDSEFTEDGETA